MRNKNNISNSFWTPVRTALLSGVTCGVALLSLSAIHSNRSPSPLPFEKALGMRAVVEGIENAFGIDFFDYFADAIESLKPFVEEELVVVDKEGKKILVNTTGTLLIRNIVMPFDAYLKKIPEDKRRFSKTV